MRTRQRLLPNVPHNQWASTPLTIIFMHRRLAPRVDGMVDWRIWRATAASTAPALGTTSSGYTGGFPREAAHAIVLVTGRHP